ncbi:hypothetical protein B0H19DRAFT_1251859 [Mycena capillaripes]|nr:hypothetical protein B0H19DRAFT_1251859 [Mycena capillaripes]
MPFRSASPMFPTHYCPPASLRSEGSSPSLRPDDLMSVDTEGDSSDAGASSIDLLLEARVLPGRGRQLFAAIPSLSFADSDNFMDLMSKPALGFVLLATGVLTNCRLMGRSCHTCRSHCMSCGVFDFTDPTSALRFSQLILELSPHFAFATEPVFQNNKFDWHLDNAEISSGNFRNWRDRVAQWVPDVQICREKSPFSCPPTPLPAHRPESATETDLQRQDPTEPEHPKSSRSSSDFTGSSARSSPRTESAATVAWLLDRAILLANWIPFNVFKASLGEEAIEFNDRLVLYDEMCHVWPLSWDAESVHVDASLSRLKKLAVSASEGESTA